MRVFTRPVDDRLSRFSRMRSSWASRSVVCPGALAPCLFTRFSVLRGPSDKPPDRSGFSTPEAVLSKFASPRGTLPEGLPRCAVRRPNLRADASTATPATAPTSRASDVSWTSLVLVREQYRLRLGRRRFWEALSYTFGNQGFEIRRGLISPSSESRRRYPTLQPPPPCPPRRRGSNWALPPTLRFGATSRALCLEEDWILAFAGNADLTIRFQMVHQDAPYVCGVAPSSAYSGASRDARDGELAVPLVRQPRSSGTSPRMTCGWVWRWWASVEGMGAWRCIKMHPTLWGRRSSGWLLWRRRGVVSRRAFLWLCRYR